MQHVIKKYANRKLYHTNEKQYITLEGIARLVQQGELVQVLDNESGDDITASILAQVVLQTQSRSGEPLPTSLLTGLIQLGGDTLSSLRKAMLHSLGADDPVDTEIARRLEVLVRDGTLASEEAQRIHILLVHSKTGESLNQQVTASDADLLSRHDVIRLQQQVDELSAAVEQLLQQQGADLGR
jgi:polyhydroxyalkanoate synthesis repressor PhaR